MVQYFLEFFRALRTDNNWEKRQFLRLFPSSPKAVYDLMEDAGFSSERYRNSWPDLIANLPSNDWSAKHFVEFMDHEVKVPRRFPIDINFRGLRRINEIKVYNRALVASLIRNLVQAQIDFKPDIVTDVEFWREALSVVGAVALPVIVIGDSHTLTFRQTIHDGNRRLIVPVNILCGGGSAGGLSNEHSISGYGNTIRRAASAIREISQSSNPTPVVLFTFGQVDLEFVYSYRRAKREDNDFDGGGFARFCSQLAFDYAKWVADLKLPKAVLVGINPPCIDDEHIYDAYLAQMETYMVGRIADVELNDSFESLASRFRMLEFPKKRERTKYHKLFNAALSAAAGSEGLLYADCFDKMIGPDGCISPKFASATGKGIHVGGSSTLRMKAQLASAAHTLAADAS